MKNLKSLVLAGAALVASAFALDAAQPAVWTATFTNNIPTAAYGGGSTNPVGTIIWTSDKGITQTNTIDLLQSTSFSIWTSVNPTATAVAANNGAIQFLSTYSPDGLIQAAGATAIVNVSATNAVQTAYTNITVTGFRYLGFPTLTSTMTNAFVTNGLITLKVFIPGRQ